MPTSISCLLAEGCKRLESTAEAPLLEAEILLEHVLGKGRTFFRAHPESAVQPTEIEQFIALIEQRLRGQPIAYLIGAREFWSRRFDVTTAVLIPRPETELLIELAIASLSEKPSPLILDLGAGSGAIAITLALERPDSRVIALDVSEDALDVMKRNADKLGASNVLALRSNWFSELQPPDRFDLVVSNPPYIPSEDPHLEQGDLRFEPRGALASGPDGLDDIRRIIQDARPHLTQGGKLMIEHGFEQADSVVHLMTEAGYAEVENHRDLQGHPRVTVARYGKPSSPN